jgi:hypothetical protein
VGDAVEVTVQARELLVNPGFDGFAFVDAMERDFEGGRHAEATFLLEVQKGLDGGHLYGRGR